MATITTGGNGNWSDASGSGAWTGTTKPDPGDSVIVADGHVIVLDENMSIASLTAAGNTGYCTCAVDVTMTLTGSGITYAGSLTAGFIRLTANTLTINGSSATCLVTTTSTGYAIITSNASTLVLNNGTSNALSCTGLGRCVHAGSSSTTNSITGNILSSNDGYCFVVTAGGYAVAGNIVTTGTRYAVSTTGTVTFTGNMISSLTSNGFAINPYGGTFTWTGTTSIAADTDLQLVVNGATLILGTSGSPLTITNAGRFNCRVASGSVTYNHLKFNNITAASQASFLGQAVTVTGPTIPAAGDVRNGTANGYSGSPATGTCYVPAAADVQFGVSVDATTGTFTAPAVGDVQSGVQYGGGGTEYTGTFVVPDAADVWAGTGDYGANGTEFTPAMRASHITVTGGAGATLSAPDILTGIVVDDVTGSATGGTITVADILTTQMTESYNADGTAPTLAQALFVIMQRLTEFSISTDTITVNKLNGTTPAYTLTMDSATTPTSSTRAT